jgi:hypothetical protein
MAEVRVSSRVNKGKRGRVFQSNLIIANVPAVSVPHIDVGPGSSPSSKKKKKHQCVNDVSLVSKSPLISEPSHVKPGASTLEPASAEPVSVNLESASIEPLAAVLELKRDLDLQPTIGDLEIQIDVQSESIERVVVSELIEITVDIQPGTVFGPDLEDYDPFQAFDPSDEFLSEHEDNEDFLDCVLLDTSSLANKGDCTLVLLVCGSSVDIPEPSSQVPRPSSQVPGPSSDSSNLRGSLLVVPGPSFQVHGSSSGQVHFSRSIPLFNAVGGQSHTAVTSSDTTVVPCGKESTVSCGKKPAAFLPLDVALFDKICKMENGKSLRNEKWAENRFNSWRASIGLDTSVKLVDLPLEDFADLLTQFFLCLVKINGERYPSGSIGNIYDSFNRIILKHQRKVMKLQKRQDPLHNIQDHHYFVQTNAAVEKAVELSRDAGANKPRVKPKSLTYVEEAAILLHPLHQLNNPKGVQKRMLYHCMAKFLIRGGQEAHNLKYKDFKRGVNEAGMPYVE